MSLAVVVLLWIVTVWRAPSARAEPWRRGLWLAFAALAAAMTLDLPPVITMVDRGGEITDLAMLLRHLCGILACAAVLDWVIALTRPRAMRRWRPARRHLFPVIAMFALSLLFFLVRRHEAADSAGVMAGDPAGTAYLTIFEAYLAGTAGLAAAALMVTAREAGTGLLRWGMWLMASGAALGVAYAVTSGALLLIRLAEGNLPGGAGRVFYAVDFLQHGAILLILAGSSLPAAAVAARAARDYRALQCLRPLWAELIATAPHVVLGAPPTRRDDLTTARTVRIRLLRRTVEIRDAALLLRGYVSASDGELIRSGLAGSGLAGERLRAATEAAWLRAGVHAKIRGLPARGPVSADPLRDGGDFASEVRWLGRVAAAYRSQAVIAAVRHVISGRVAA